MDEIHIEGRPVKDSAVIYEQFYKGVQKLPPEQKAEAYDAYCEFAMYGRPYEGDNLAIAVLIEAMSGKVKQANEKYQEKVDRLKENRMKSREVSRNHMKSHEITTVTVTDTVSKEKSSSYEEPKEKAEITLTLNTGEEYPLYPSDIAEYRTLYPSVDVMQELRNMCGWCRDNPTRRKTKAGIRRFIGAWLSREQNRGGYQARQPAKPPDRRGVERQTTDYSALMAQNVMRRLGDNGQ